MSPRRTLGPAIRAIREALGLTLLQVAEDIEVTTQHLGRIERGLKQPSDVVIRRLAERLRVDRAAFTYLEDAEDPEPAEVPA